MFLKTLFELLTSANDCKLLGDFVSRAEMSVRVRKGIFLMVDTLEIRSLVTMSDLELCNYIYRPSPRQREAAGGHGRPPWRQREATGASSRVQNLARQKYLILYQRRQDP